jgi:hypothetical protein
MGSMSKDFFAVKAKLNTAFKALRKAGYFARQSFMCCQSCGCYAVPKALAENYVFYHKQDADNLRAGGRVYLSWSGDGTFIGETFRQTGFEVQWDGKSTTRILVGLNPVA